MKSIFSALIVAALFVGSTAHAGKDHKDHKMKMEEKWNMMDTNKDGKVSADEHAMGAKDMFMKMDADKDGFVSTAEFKAKHDEMKK